MIAVNTRDLGGLPAAGGRWTASGILVRCAADRSRVPPALREAASTAGGARMVDLRDPAELVASADKSQDAVPAGVTIISRPLNDPTFHQFDASERDEQFFVDLYTVMLPAAYRVAGQILGLVATSVLPVVTACRLGKDRTGVVVMALLHLLGVLDRAILADFAASADWFRAHPQWVRDYALGRGEDPAKTHSRLVLPPSVGERTLGRMRARAVALRRFAELDDRTLEQARRRLLINGVGR